MRITKNFKISLLLLSCASAAYANVVGTDAQNFNPTTNGLDFVTVQSSETLKPGILNFGLFVNYSNGTLPRLGASKKQYEDSLWSSDLSFGAGLMKDWDAGVSFPAIIQQNVTDSTGFQGRFSKQGNTEIKVNTKYRLLGNDSGGVAVVASANFNLIKNNPYAGSGAGPTLNFEAAFDHTFDRVAVALNFGYRLRDPGTSIPGIPIQTLRNQWIASTAASYLFPEIDTKAIFEIFGSRPVDTSDLVRNPQEDSFEALLGVKHDINSSFAIHTGVGHEIIRGIASPNFRWYAGLNYALGPIFAKKDKPSDDIILIKSTEQEDLFLTRRILFDFNSANLAGEYERVLANIYAYLNALPSYKQFVIEGHTDSVGGDMYNLRLSETRANSIREYLVKTYKLDPKKVIAIGYGESRPIADNGNYQGRQENRRVEFRIEK